MPIYSFACSKCLKRSNDNVYEIERFYNINDRPDNIIVNKNDACPVCGSKRFTFIISPSQTEANAAESTEAYMERKRGHLKSHKYWTAVNEGKAPMPSYLQREINDAVDRVKNR